MIEIYCSAYAISRLKATDCGEGRGVPAAAVKRERWKVFSKFRAKVNVVLRQRKHKKHEKYRVQALATVPK